MMVAVVSRTALVLFLATGLAPGCGPRAAEPGAGEPEEAAQVDAAAPADTAPARPGTWFGETALAYTTPGFEHNPHGDVACSNCHAVMPGHAAHVAVGCLECHGDAGARSGAATVRPAECQACHHRADPPRDCARCHAPGEVAAPIGVMVAVKAADRVRERELRFAHPRHAALACTRCHELPRVLPAPACSACHDRHHRADADCAACHAQPAAGTHDLTAHVSCGGSGCHTNAAVIALPSSRPVCLVCHQDRTDHEPGRECAQCHLIREAARPSAGVHPGNVPGGRP
jgi:hypothetical protein